MADLRGTGTCHFNISTVCGHTGPEDGEHIEWETGKAMQKQGRGRRTVRLWAIPLPPQILHSTSHPRILT